jgi:hypothetical protein
MYVACIDTFLKVIVRLQKVRGANPVAPRNKISACFGFVWHGTRGSRPRRAGLMMPKKVNPSISAARMIAADLAGDFGWRAMPDRGGGELADAVRGAENQQSQPNANAHNAHDATQLESH